MPPTPPSPHQSIEHGHTTHTTLQTGGSLTQCTTRHFRTVFTHPAIKTLTARATTTTTVTDPALFSKRLTEADTAESPLASKPASALFVSPFVILEWVIYVLIKDWWDTSCICFLTFVRNPADGEDPLARKVTTGKEIHPNPAP